MGSAGAALLGALPLAACGGGGEPTVPPGALSLSFNAVAKSLADAVTVPAGYTAAVLYAVGDPLDTATPDYRNDGTDTGFETRFGDHHDGMEYFGLNAAGTARDVAGSERGILALNHEALTDQFLHANGVTPNPRPAAEADKEIPAHGLSFVEVRKLGGKFGYARDSVYNRRVTPLTPIVPSGPVRGHALLKTRFSPAGTECRGTINN
jgi:secreted PhoX family phosphatase